MKITKTLLLVFALLAYFGAANTAKADKLKWMRVGKIHAKAVDSGSMHESIGGQWGAHIYSHYDDFQQASVQSRGWHLGVIDFTDENGTEYPIKTAGGGGGGFDEVEHTIPVPNEEGFTIKRYFRDELPAIYVDDPTLNLQDPLLPGDEINPQKTGSADVMSESWIRTSLGITIHQKMYAYSQKNHDDYVVYDWVFTNTGNVDLDDEVELEGQTLDSLYFGRAMHHYNMGMWDPWYSHYGEFQTDTLRMSYSYPRWSPGADRDDFGNPDEITGYPEDAMALGEAVLFVSGEPNATEAPADDHEWGKPGWSMTGYHSNELKIWKQPTSQTSPDNWATLYQIMSEGWNFYDGEPYYDPDDADDYHAGLDGYPPESQVASSGNYKVRMDVRGAYENVYAPQDFNYQWHPNNHYAVGPWTLESGDSIRIVWAEVMGVLEPESAWELGQQYVNDQLTSDPNGKLPPMADIIYSSPENSDWDDNDVAKDQVVYSTVDTLFRNAGNAQWLVDNNYQAPIPPPAPSIEVTSQPDKIIVQWTPIDPQDGRPDPDAFNVYRAIGNPGPTVRQGEFFGTWELMQSFNAEEASNAGYVLEDAEAERGQSYYYYVASYYDAATTAPGRFGVSEMLESGRFLNRTTRPALLKRPPGELDEVVVVPNPFNINDRDNLYTGEENRINFLNLPGICTIRIYTESGDLVKVIEHTDGSGDEAWGDLPNEQQATRSGQRIVSGIYIAHIETPEGESEIVKFVVVR